jgi:hypothetical protein
MSCYFSAQLGAGLRSVRSSTTLASPTGDMELGAQEMRNTDQTDDRGELPEPSEESNLQKRPPGKISSLFWRSGVTAFVYPNRKDRCEWRRFRY